jgi:hypothetical protein
MFGLVIGSLALVYYAYVLFRYYCGPSLVSAAKSTRKPGGKASAVPELYPIVHDLVNECTPSWNRPPAISMNPYSSPG